MSAKKSRNWKEVGQFVAVFVTLFSVITATLKKIKVGPEIIEWVTTGSGKDFFVQKLKEIGAEFLSSTAPILRAVIDTNINPRLPFAGATIEKHARVGKVTIEKRADGLYIDGKKVGLYLSERQLNGQTIKGYELRTELDDKPVLSASILDFLMAHPEFIPEDWKQDENGNIIFIYFWATIYRYFGRFRVRCLYWDDGAWHEGYDWLVNGWDSSGPAAALVS